MRHHRRRDEASCGHPHLQLRGLLSAAAALPAALATAATDAALASAVPVSATSVAPAAAAASRRQ